MLSEYKTLVLAALIGLANMKKFKIKKAYKKTSDILKNTPALKQSFIENGNGCRFDFSTLRLSYTIKENIYTLDEEDIIVYDNLGNNIYQGSLEELEKLTSNIAFFGNLVTIRHSSLQFEKLLKLLKKGSYTSMKELTEHVDRYECDYGDILIDVVIKEPTSFYKKKKKGARVYGFELDPMLEDEIVFYKQLDLMEMEIYYQKN